MKVVIGEINTTNAGSWRSGPAVTGVLLGSVDKLAYFQLLREAGLEVFITTDKRLIKAAELIENLK